MGRGHALSGVAVWLGGWATAQSLGLADPKLDVLVVGSAVCAGAALLPDLDHPKSRVANCAGPISSLLGWILAKFGAGVHAITRTDLDRPDRDGHRTVSHTLTFALLMGWLAVWAGGRWGPYVAAGLVAVLGGLGADAVLDVLPRKWQSFKVRRGAYVHWDVVITVTLALAAFAYVPGSAWWLGLAVAVGCFAHCLGDAVTASACPFLWPLPLPTRVHRRGGGTEVRWQLWKLIGPPRWMRFKVDGPVERFLVMPALFGGAVYAGYLLSVN